MPHLQTLVERHKDEAFELIGINSNDSPEAYSAGLKAHNVTWLSAYQGEANAISELYQVGEYPTYVLIDAKGKIRARGSTNLELDNAIAELLKEAQEEAAK